MSSRNGMQFTLNEDGTWMLTGKLPDNPQVSSSEKNFLLASSKGGWNTGEHYNGKEITIGLNMYCEKSDLKKPATAVAKKKK